MNKYDYLVVGAGLTGATFARQKAEMGYTVLVIDKRTHIAGNAYDKPLMRIPGMFIHIYGPHLFHTNSDKVFEFLSKFTEWRPYEHRVTADLPPFAGLPLPVNFKTMEKLVGKERFPLLKAKLLEHFKPEQRITMSQLKAVEGRDRLLKFLYEEVYAKVFKGYTEKMWGLTLEQLGPTVADRVPLIVGDDDRYFGDKHQCMPAHGYTKMVEKMLFYPNIEVRTATEPMQVPELWNNQIERKFYTGPIDEFFGYKHGKLPYRSIDFEFTDHGKYRPMTDDVKWEGPATHNFPMFGHSTRISSMAAISGMDPNESDVRVREFPVAADDHYPPFYPVPTQANRELYAKYTLDAVDLPNIKFGGRLGTYQYLNMDQAVAQALKMAEEF